MHVEKHQMAALKVAGICTFNFRNFVFASKVNLSRLENGFISWCVFSELQTVEECKLGKKMS